MARETLREAVARLVREAVSVELAGTSSRGAPMITVSSYAGLWLAQRRQLKIVSVEDDETRLRLHVLPFCGELVPAVLAEWRPKHVRALILKLRAEGKLSPRTVRHVYAVLSNLFRCAVADEMLPATPCVLPAGVLPPNIDKDPDWRARAIFTRSELEALLFDSRIDEHRRVLYGLKGVAALRHSEASRLRWEQIEARAPLNAILLGRTKAKRQRAVPIHATLQWLLDHWRLQGWRLLFGRAPHPRDLVVPALRAEVRLSTTAQHDFGADLERLGLRHRRGHDLKRTMISLARADGARSEVLRSVTHGRRPDILEQYTEWPWPVACEEIGKLRLGLGRGSPDQLELAFPEPAQKRAGSTARSR